jgi:transcriptional regulator with PAS, ATPase and Fis domain
MQNSNPLAQALLDIQDDPFVLIDRDYRIVAANRAYADTYETSGQAVVGRACYEVSHHATRPCHQNGENCPLVHVLATGQACEVVHVHFDRDSHAERVRLTGYPVRGADGGFYLGERIFRLDDGEKKGTKTAMVGSSIAFLAALGRLSAAAQTEAPILLSGESGVGKELAARYLHEHSRRKHKAWFAVDCATISEALFESELFGHERGAFTGCVGRKQGLFELADGGTLFLDELGEIPHYLQAKLLRVLETGEFRRVGGNAVLRANVRLVAATNRHLPDLIAAGQFRQDLYYRVSVIDITLPPLRQRRSDIPALAQAMLDRAACGESKRQRLSPAALEKLGAYDFPGNIRELRNIMLNASLNGGPVIDADDIVFRVCREPAGRAPATGAQDLVELLAQCNGHRADAAKSLGISERTLYRKLRNLRQIS